MSALARQLEETFRSAVAAAAGAGVSVRMHSEDSAVGAFTVSAPGELLTFADEHGLAADERGRVSSAGTLPAPLEDATDYWILADGLTGTAAKLSASKGGPVIALTDAGTGAHTFTRRNRGEPRPLPAVVIEARELQRNDKWKWQNRWATDMELRAECRAEGAEQIETLSGNVKTAVETATGLSGWDVLQLHPRPDEERFEGATRVVVRVWQVVALRSV